MSRLDIATVLEVTVDQQASDSSQLGHLLHHDKLNNIIFKGNWIYWYSLLHLNYTTYDLQHETETVKPKTEHCNIMLLSLIDHDSLKTHPFCYACIIGIYHTNIIHTGSNSRNYQSWCLKFLWVHWFELLNLPSSWEYLDLNIAHFVPMASTNTFGFVDPADILQCCHLIPVFKSRKLHPDGIVMSHHTCDLENWKCYYISQ